MFFTTLHNFKLHNFILRILIFKVRKKLFNYVDFNFTLVYWTRESGN